MTMVMEFWLNHLLPTGNDTVDSVHGVKVKDSVRSVFPQGQTSMQSYQYSRALSSSSSSFSGAPPSSLQPEPWTRRQERSA